MVIITCHEIYDLSQSTSYKRILVMSIRTRIFSFPSGGPFEVGVRNPATGHAVTATGLGLHQARVNKPTSFVIETLSQPSKEFDVIITGPQDWAVPVKCYQQKDGNLLAEYTPHMPGAYKIEVLCSTKHVKGSPFQCTAFDASRVILDHSKTVTAVGEPCLFKCK